MTSLLENKIMIFSNRGYLDAYYRANLNLGFAVEAALLQISSAQNNIPFTNNLLTTDTNDTNEFLENTNILSFTQNMQTVTDTFISSVIEIMVDNRESRNSNNYSDTLNTSFFSTFEGIQTNFLKELANYFSMYLFFTDQIAVPQFFPIYGVVDSNLDFSTFVLSDKDNLLKANLRNMNSSDFKKYRKAFVHFKESFLNCSVANENLINTSMHFSDSFTTIVDKLKEFIRFSENMIDALDDYIMDLDTYYIIIRDEDVAENLHYSQSTLESKLRVIIDNIASTEIASSVTIVEGGEDFVVGDLLTVPTPDSNEQNAIVEVTGIINGHIREVGISFSGQDFAVDDTLLDTAGNNTFNVIVNAIQNGLVTSVTENNDGSGFEVDDDSNNLTFQVEQFFPRLILSGTLTDIIDKNDDSSPKVTFKFTDTPTLLGSISATRDWDSLIVSTIYEQTGISGATTFTNPILNINEIVTDSNLSGRITYQTQGSTDKYEVSVHFDTATEASDFYTVVAAANLINTSIDIDIQDNDATSSINTNKVGIDLQVTEIDAELNSIELDLSVSASNYQLSDTLTVSTSDSNHSDAVLNITTIHTSNLSNFSFSHDDANVEYDYDANLGFTYGNNSFEASVVEMRFSPSDDLQVANNTDSNSSLNDTFYVDVDDDADVQVKVTEIECDSNTIELEIDATNTGSYTMNQSFSPTIDSNTITTQVTSLLIDSNTIQLTSDSNFEASQIGTSFSGLTYGGDDTNEISALVTGIQIASNTIQLELIDSNDSNYSITTISENFGAQEITITPSQITIEADALAPIIVVDTSESVELGQSYSMEYGNDSTNVISATVDEIILPADTLSFRVGEVDTNENVLILTLPDGHLINEPYASEMEGIYYPELVYAAADDTFDSLGITDFSQPHKNVHFTNDNGYVLYNSAASGGRELSNNHWWFINDSNGNHILEIATLHPDDGNDFTHDGWVYWRNFSDGRDFPYHNQSHNTALGQIFATNEVVVDSNEVVVDSNEVVVDSNEFTSIFDSNIITSYSAEHKFAISQDKNHAIYAISDYDEIALYIYNTGVWTSYNTYNNLSEDIHVSISNNGEFMYFSAHGYYESLIYKSSDYGSSFNSITTLNEDGSSQLHGSFSDDGVYGLVGMKNDSDSVYLNLTTDSTSSFSPVYLSNDTNDTSLATYQSMRANAVSSTGQYMSVLTGPAKGSISTEYENRIFTSSDYGSTWQKVDIEKSWKEIVMNDSGQYQVAITENEKIYVSSDYGSTFTTIDLTKNWDGVDVSADGRVQSVISGTGNYISLDFGSTWTLFNTDVYGDVSISSDSIHFTDETIDPIFAITSATSSNYGTYSITFDGDSNVTVVVDSNGVSTSHPDLTISDTNFVDASGLFTLVTSSFSGSVNQYTITHNSITATDNSFDDGSSPFSLSSTPTGLLSGFTVTHPQFVATDSNADLSSTSFSLVETPKGIMIIDVSHDPITAINDTFESDSNNFIQLAATPTGSVVSFSQSHPLISDLASETYDADGSPFVLKDGHPHGTMTEFRLVSGESTIDVLVDKIIYDSNSGNYTLNSYTSDSNDEISEWEIQFNTKPNGIVIQVDTNIMNISLGEVSDGASVQFESGYTMAIDAIGSIVDHSITQDGSGFTTNDSASDLTLSSSNTGAALPSITSFTVKNGKITGVSLLTGGLNYDISDTITVSKTGATSATLTVAAVRDGMISGLTINDGGANYTLDDVLTVTSSGGGNGATIVLSDIDNGHISTVQVIESGSGFTESETITMTHSRDASLPNQPTIQISTVSTSEDISLLSKIEDLNEALEG
jgi:hypothetical protein